MNPTLAQKTILLVEDDPLLSKVESLILEKHGYRVISVLTGEKAVQMADEHRGINLILMDIDLGKGIDGTEAAQRIIEKHDIPVLFLSSHTDSETVEKTEKITSYGYVVKNTGETVLLASIKMAFKLHEANLKLKQRDYSLSLSEEKFRNILNFSVDAILLADLNGLIIDANLSAQELIGYTKNEFMKLSLEDLFSSQEKSKSPCEFGQIRAGKTICRERELTRKDKSVISVEMNVKLMPDQTIQAIIRDITERKKIEQKLKESETRFVEFMNYLPGLAYIKNRDRKIIYTNLLFKTKFGLSEDKWLGKTCEDIWPGEVGNKIKLNDETILSTQEFQTFEEKVPSNGEMKTYYSIKFPIKMPDGQELLGGISIDITERKKTEDMLIQSETKFSTAFNVFPDPMTISELMNNLILDINPAFLNWTRYTREEVIGKTPNELNFWVNKAEMDYVMNTLLSGRPVMDYEIKIRLKTGEIRIARLTAILFKLNSKNYILFIAHDTTDFVKTQNTLKETQVIFNLFMEHSPVYVFFKDHNIRAIQLSRNYEKMLGMPLEKILGKTMDELFPSPMAKLMIEDDKKILHEGKTIEVIEELNNRIYSTIKFPIQRERDTPLLAGFTVDITELKETEKKLSLALEEKKALLRELQHRIKNSLSLITGIIGLEISRMEDQKVRDILKSINSRILSLSDLYNYLYKSDSVKIVPVDDYLLQVSYALKKTYMQNDSPIQITAELDKLIMDVGDAATLGLILNELLTNAIKYGFSENQPGTIAIRLKKEAQLAYLEVSNDGNPLPTDFVLTQTTGLGLTLVQILSDNLKGILTHDTILNDDKLTTIFLLKFPYQEIEY